MTSVSAITSSADQPAAPQLLTMRQVAERTGASESFWRQPIAARDIRMFRVGDLCRIAETDLAEWLAEHSAPRGAAR